MTANDWVPIINAITIGVPVLVFGLAWLMTRAYWRGYRAGLERGGELHREVFAQLVIEHRKQVEETNERHARMPSTNPSKN